MRPWLSCALIPLALLVASSTTAPFAAEAENGPIAALVNMAASGSFCGAIRASELRENGIDCPDPARGLASFREVRSTPEILRTAIYRDAATLELPRNECLRQQTDAINRDPALRRQWISFAVSAWLGLRKAQMAREFCNVHFYRYLTPSIVRERGVKQAFEDWERDQERLSSSQSRLEVMPADREAQRSTMRETCLNDGQMAAMRNAEQLYASTLPVLSSPAAFQAVDDIRSRLVNDATGQPLSDAEIAGMDLRDLSGLRLNLETGDETDSAFQGVLSQAVAWRGDVRGGLTRTAAGEAPSASIRNFLYDDGALWQSLHNHGFIQTDLLGRPREIASAARCVLAYHDPTLVGTLLQFGAEAIALGGVAGALRSGAARALADAGGQSVASAAGASAEAGAGLFGRARQMLHAGAGPIFLKDTALVYYNSCRSRTGAATRTRDQGREHLSNSMRGSGFVASFAYTTWDVAFDPASLPACADPRVARNLIESSHQAHCMLDTITMLLPLSLAIPVETMRQ